MERSRPVVSYTRRLLIPIGTLPIVSLEYGRKRCRRYCALAPCRISRCQTARREDGLSASKTHPTRPFRGRLGRRPRCEHGESLAHPHYVVNTRSRDVVI